MQFKLRVVGHVDEIDKGTKQPGLSQDLVSEMETFLNTPIRELKKPLAVHSQILGEIIYLVSEEGKSKQVEAEAKVAYTPEEIITLLEKFCSIMDPDEWVTLLKGVHTAKKIFEGSRVYRGM